MTGLFGDMKKLAATLALTILAASAALAAEKAAETLRAFERSAEIVIDKPYIVVPLLGKGGAQSIRLVVDGKVVRLYSKVGLARSEEQADFWGSWTWPASPWMAKSACRS